MINQASEAVRRGGVIAYPSEAVYGLGCDPLNRDAVARVNQIKSRPAGKGFILVAATPAQLEPFCDMTNADFRRRAAADWPGPVTWVFPQADGCPEWLCGAHPGIAVRVSAHPVVAALCRACDSALVSTSANSSGAPPAVTAQQVKDIFGDALDYIVDGEVGELARPTVIRDVASGQVIRK